MMLLLSCPVVVCGILTSLTSWPFYLIVLQMDDPLSSSWHTVVHTLTAGLNDWGSLHPVMVHMPTALLFAAPLFIIIGLVFQRNAKIFYLSALILMLIGTLSIFLAASTGDKASEHIKPNPDVVATLDHHVRLAETIRLAFSLLTSTFTAYILLFSYLTKKFSPKFHRITLVLFLVIYAYSLILLLDTAHQGGKLVHHHGIVSELYRGNHK
jgi:uncharacterized membrane protein